MYIVLDKCQIIFPRPDNELHHYTLDIQHSTQSIDFICCGWYDSAPLPSDEISLSIPLNIPNSAGWAVNKNIAYFFDYYGRLQLKIQLKTKIINELRNLLAGVGFKELIMRD